MNKTTEYRWSGGIEPFSEPILMYQPCQNLFRCPRGRRLTVRYGQAEAYPLFNSLNDSRRDSCTPYLSATKTKDLKKIKLRGIL